MKKAIATIVIVMIATTSTAQANEIPGTRVLGQNATCKEGEGKGIEINATTKEEWSYCMTREPLRNTVSPTPAPSVQNSQTIQINDNMVEPTPIQVETTTVRISPTPPASFEAPKRAAILDMNVTTQVTTIREETWEEWFMRWSAAWTAWYENLNSWIAALMAWAVNE